MPDAAMTNGNEKLNLRVLLEQLACVAGYALHINEFGFGCSSGNVKENDPVSRRSKMRPSSVEEQYAIVQLVGGVQLNRPIECPRTE